MGQYLVCFDCARELVDAGGELVSGTPDTPIVINPGKLCDMHGNTQAMRAVEFKGDTLPAPKHCAPADVAAAKERADARREGARGRRRAHMRVPLGPETEIAVRVLCALIPDGTIFDDRDLVRRAVKVSRMLLSETDNG